MRIRWTPATATNLQHLAPPEGGAAPRLRALTLALFLAGAIGVAIDLALIGHYEGAWQVAPLMLLGASAMVGVVMAFAPTRGILLAFRVALLLVLAGGGGGLWLHYRANLEFEGEVSPSLTGIDLVWKAIQGASPPSAAPATLVHLAVLGWASTVRHPALRRRAGPSVQGDSR